MHGTSFASRPSWPAPSGTHKADHAGHRDQAIIVDFEPRTTAPR
jgi:hypothetical protein